VQCVLTELQHRAGVGFLRVVHGNERMPQSGIV